MWVMVMFDLPVMTKRQRRAANGYRYFLRGDGFSMIQLSVYIRWCVSPKSTDAVIRSVAAHVPPEGLVRVLRLTNEQWSRTQSFFGEKEIDPGKKPPQLALFPEASRSEIAGNPAISEF